MENKDKKKVRTNKIQYLVQYFKSKYITKENSKRNNKGINVQDEYSTSHIN